MATKRDCTQNPSSGNEAPNAFTPEFLSKLHDREDAPLAALEAELCGPWKVVELPVESRDSHAHDAERWAVLRVWEDPQAHAPAGTFRFRDSALLYAAALEVASRGTALRVVDAQDHDEEGAKRRLAVVQSNQEGEEQVVGHIPIWDEAVAAALRHVEALLRSSGALAQLLEAGCGPIAELLGRRLMAEE